MDKKTSPNLGTSTVGLLIGLFLQYILGMATNLFVHFPESQTETQHWEFAWHQISLALHIIIGLLLFIGSISVLVRSIMAKDKTWITYSSTGLLSILIAGMSGALFVSTQNDIYSFVMSLGFLTAIISYGRALYIARPKLVN